MLKIADNQLTILAYMSSFTHHSYRNFNVLQYSEILCTAKLVILPQYPMHHYVKNHFYSYDYPSGSINSGNWVQDAWQRMERVSTHSDISTGKKSARNIRYPYSFYCQSVSFSQSLGNPIAAVSTFGYSASSDLNRATNVF